MATGTGQPRGYSGQSLLDLRVTDIHPFSVVGWELPATSKMLGASRCVEDADRHHPIIEFLMIVITPVLAAVILHQQPLPHAKSQDQPLG